MDNKPLSPQEFEKIYKQVPRLCVDLVIKSQGGIILTRRNLSSWKDKWHFPGGTVLYKETIEGAAKRIANNELRINIKINKLLGYIEFPSEETERGFGYSVSLAILCDADEGTLKINDEASDVGIFKEIPENMLAEQGEFLNIHRNEIWD